MLEVAALRVTEPEKDFLARKLQQLEELFVGNQSLCNVAGQAQPFQLRLRHQKVPEPLVLLVAQLVVVFVLEVIDLSASEVLDDSCEAIAMHVHHLHVLQLLQVDLRHFAVDLEVDVADVQTHEVDCGSQQASKF